ncbi:hypothetical protein CCH79_00008250, partial [Gambusia affinis]
RERDTFFFSVGIDSGLRANNTDARKILLSCAKVEKCNPYPLVKMNRALFSKMTVTRFSLVFSGCLVTLLIWGCTNVICLDNDKATVQLVTTTVKTTTCVNGLHCQSICDICEHRYGQPSVECLSFLFDEYLHLFSEQMRSLNSTDWCVWDKVSSFYSDFSTCTEHLSDCLGIPWPNSLVEKLFVNIHSEYFKTCPTEEFSDPPPGIVFALVITPICLIPVMVSLVMFVAGPGMLDHTYSQPVLVNVVVERHGEHEGHALRTNPALHVEQVVACSVTFSPHVISLGSRLLFVVVLVLLGQAAQQGSAWGASLLGFGLFQ